MKPRRFVVSEKVEQAHGVQLLLSIGAEVYVSGTRRKRGDYQGTMQTPGIPDVEAFLKGAFSQRDREAGYPDRLILKWECKRVGGRLSPAQQRYQELCAAARIAYVVGPLDALIAWLAAHHYINADDVAHYRRPA